MTKILDGIDCRHWVGSEEEVEAARAKLAHRKDIAIHTLPNLEFFLEEGDVLHYPYDKPWEEAMFDPVFVIHSSGTTGQ